ncbi:MAG: phosphotransferase [Acidimicrobiia bacterium]|nr:phosphotransferase [Acidimicrobiia bacterium]
MNRTGHRSRDPAPVYGLREVTAALDRFGIEPTSVELISRTENVVFAVGAGEAGRFVARLHRPGYNTLEELESEVAWVSSLADDGVPVPRPVPMIEGGHHVPVVVDGTEHHLGVIEWVNGAPLRSAEVSDDDLVGHYRTIGVLAARIRAHGRRWSRPDGFVRRHWSTEAFFGAEPIWGRFWEVDGLTTPQRDLFSRARRRLASVLDTISTDSDRYGLIHADLHPGNIMINGAMINGAMVNGAMVNGAMVNGGKEPRLSVIDFDDSGFGWYAFELAVALHPILGHNRFADAKAALIAGYREIVPISEPEVGLVDVFLVVRALMLVGWLDGRRELPAYQLLPEFAASAQSMIESADDWFS